MSTAQIRRLLAESAEDINNEVLQSVWGIPGYDIAHMSRDDLAGRIPISIHALLASLENGARLTETARRSAKEIGTSRALSGVPLEAMLQSWNTSERVCVQHVLRHADAFPGSEIRQVITQLNVIFGEVARLSAAEYRRTQSEVTAYYDRLSTDLVARLVGEQQTTPDEIRQQAHAVGSDPAQPHAAIVVVVAAAEAGPSLRIERHLLALLAGHTTGRILLGRLDQHLVLLCPMPDEGDDLLDRLLRRAAADPHKPGSFLLATSRDSAPLDDITDVCAKAREAAQIGSRRGWTDRVVTFEDVCLDVMLARNPDATAVLAATLDPLLGRPELLTTLREYLRHGMSARATARALYVHPNTVPYRLRTIEQLLGRSLSDVTGLTDLLIALHHLDTESAPAHAGPC
ncbi:helix-turn-helix domain-containing protein [Nonomuraea sp. B1E8]|uniref:PucR family transcriptional regulator n=1 Tax=unclassified Nonomuraea TaxID=2593643 RepID=UPI00325E019A